MLVWRFVEEFSKAFGKRIESIPKENIDMLQRYPWPGNVRELRNLVERAVIGASGPRLTVALPPVLRRATQRAARRRGEGTRQECARQHRVADSRRGRRRRTAGAQSHDSRDADGETGTPALAPLTPAFRAPSAIWGNALPPVAERNSSIGGNSKQHRSIALRSCRAPHGTSAAPVRRVVRLAVALAAPACGTEQLVHALRFLASPTSIEPGCLGCRVWTEDSDESVRYVEEWATEDAMRLRVRSERFTRLLEVLESAPRHPAGVRFRHGNARPGLRRGGARQGWDLVDAPAPEPLPE